MPAWSLKTRRAPSRHCRGARVCGHTTTAMHDSEYTRPPKPPRHYRQSLLIFFLFPPISLHQLERTARENLAQFYNVHFPVSSILCFYIHLPAPTIHHSIHYHFPIFLFSNFRFVHVPASTIHHSIYYHFSHPPFFRLPYMFHCLLHFPLFISRSKENSRNLILERYNITGDHS